MVPWTWLNHELVGHTQEGNKLLASILGKAVFDYPKPMRLIRHFLQIATDKDDIILDSFAGSGTTAPEEGKVVRSLVEEIRSKKYYLPELELIMVNEDDLILGYVMFSRFHIEGRYEDELLILTPVAVRTEYQRQHISKELIEYGFEQEYDETSEDEQVGFQIVQTFDDIQRRACMPLNKGLFMEHLISGLSVESFDEEEYLTLYEKIDPLIERVAGLSPDGIANKKAGEAYMEQLRKDKSFKFTKSGLAYKMLKEGKGKNYTEDNEGNYVGNYVGKHLDGTVFDSSEGELMPFSIEFQIEGVSEILQLMKPGGKAIVVVPSNLAYGISSINYAIGPNETLIFEIEIIDSQQ